MKRSSVELVRYSDHFLLALANEGALEDVGRGTYDGAPSWRITRYGRQFLHFLREGPWSIPKMDEACMYVGWLSNGPSIVLCNTGLGLARDVLVSAGTTNVFVSDNTSFVLPGGEERRILLAQREGLDPNPFTVEWTDGCGRHSQTEVLDGVASYTNRNIE